MVLPITRLLWWIRKIWDSRYKELDVPKSLRFVMETELLATPFLQDIYKFLQKMGKNLSKFSDLLITDWDLYPWYSVMDLAVFHIKLFDMSSPL
jgi:hypothetical protein